MPTTTEDVADQSTGVRRIAVAGNPNSGKTSIFNRLTGLRQKVGNYPGVTVEKREGRLAGTNVVLLDLPGTYSLSARSPEEEIARDLLLGRIKGIERPDSILLVIDASNLERNLYLACQILEFGTPVLIACNMMDIARQRGQRVDCEALSRELGVPVIPTEGHTGAGIDTLRQAMQPQSRQTPHPRSWRLSEPFEEAVNGIARVMEDSKAVPPHAVRAGALLWLMDYLSDEPAGRRPAERFLGNLSPSHAEALCAIADTLSERIEDPATVVIEARYTWIAQVVRRVVSVPDEATSATRRSHRPADRIDRILTHRVFGLLIFGGVMFALFLGIFSGAEPLMDLIERGQRMLSDAVGAQLSEGPLRSLLTDGIITGVGAVVVFFPQICILFLFLSILEDSGYMARAAFLMDRMMSRVGLHGKSFIPLLSSYACAIPGILATRTIENRRDRFTTILVAPLMSCSARLPIYIIVIGAVFGERLWLKAGVMFGLYALGTAVALGVALLLKKTLFAGPKPTFILELPPYHMPQPKVILRTMWDRSKLFLTGAGTTIFAVSVVIWALSYFPRLDETERSEASRGAIAHVAKGDEITRDGRLASEQLRHSYLGRLGRGLEPAIEPLGFDWRIGVGILSSFMAREVFVSTMGITYSLGEADESSPALQKQFATAQWPDGRRVLTPLVGVGLMVFYVLACQCVSTLAVVRRETGSWRWPAVMFSYMTVLAYLASLFVYQVGSRLGWG
ncbi:MAG: ferrous iron transport protein B [Phycisphaerae bacterium]